MVPTSSGPIPEPVAMHAGWGGPSGHDARVGPEQLLALLDNTSAVIYMRDLDGRYMLVNRQYERLFKVRREEIIGLTDHDLFPAEIADEFRANDLQAASLGGPVQVEEVAPGEDGPHTYITVKFPLIDAEGKPYAVCGISTDITDRKRAEDQVSVLNTELEQRVRQRTAELEASTKELDAFAYSVSHDLRAPLRSIHGFSQVLLEDYAGQLDETGVTYLGRLQANASRMAQLIDDLLRLSRTTRAELSRRPIELGELARATLDELRATEPGRDVEVLIEGPMNAVGDAHLVGLALQNLITNAWKFTSKRSAARITVGSMVGPSDACVFFVRDNGAGFDPRFANKLFEPFQRLHTSIDFEGSGIGLAIVHRVIRRHGGTIWAESAPDEGATFFFTLASSAVPTEPEDEHAD
jgi:PAS domain S-box-containing protein